MEGHGKLSPGDEVKYARPPPERIYVVVEETADGYYLLRGRDEKNIKTSAHRDMLEIVKKNVRLDEIW